MSILFQTLDVHLRESYGRQSTEFSLQPKQERRSEPPDRRSKLTILVKPDRMSSLRLETGEVFEELQGSLELQPSDEPRPIASADKLLNQIGYIQYLNEGEDGARYKLWALIPRSQFTDLVTAMHYGQMPLFITVDIEGLQFGGVWKWDNKANSLLPMISIEFSMKLR